MAVVHFWTVKEGVAGAGAVITAYQAVIIYIFAYTFHMELRVAAYAFGFYFCFANLKLKQLIREHTHTGRQ